MRAVAAMFCAASSAGLARAMPDADDLHRVRADAIADDVGAHGGDLAYIASDQPSSMGEGLKTFHRVSKPGDSSFRCNWRALSLDVAANFAELAKGGSC